VGTSLAAEPLLALAVTVTAEQRVDSVLQSIVEGLASQPGVALARIWLVPSADLPAFCPSVSDPADCLCLVASAGTPINSPGEDWRFLQGRFARMPFDVGKVGQVATSRQPILIEDVGVQDDWIVRPEWAKREEICSFVGHPLIFRDKLLGVIAVFSRHPLGQQEFTWLGLFANQAAVAISNARAEQALQSSERNLATIINTIPTAAWTTRPDGYCDFLNQVWLDYAGMSAEQAQGWGWAEAIHPEDGEQLVEVWQSSLASGIPVDTEARIRRFDSSYRWFLIRGNPLRDESGNILKWYGTCTDIDDRKRAEEALQSRELDARSLLDTMPGLLARLSPDGTPEFFNRQFLQYLGRSIEEIRKWKTSDIIHPDDLAHNVEALGNAISGGEPFDFEYRIRRFDGVYRWFHARNVPLHDVEGRILHWNVLVTDIDDRKNAEEAVRSSQRDLSLMIDAIPGMIHTARPDGSLDYFNHPWLEYMGCSLSDIEGWNWTARIHPDDLPGILDKWRACVASGENFEYETRVRRGDGQYRWMFHRKVPLRDEHGNIVRWYGTSLDIEDRKRAEEALKSSERNLSLMINAIPTSIGVMRADGTPLYGNQGVTDYTGLTLEEMQKETFRSRIFHPDDMERLHAERRLAFSRPVPFENEQRALGKDGKYRWFLFRYKPLLDETGKIDRWYMAAFDIDDRKRAEEQVEQTYLRLAEAQRLSKTGSFITDLVADEHNWSEETFRIFDFDPATKVTVQRIREIIQPEDLPSFEATLARAMTGADVDFVFRIVTSRNVMKHIRGMARIMVQDADRPLFIGALQDITESKMAEEALDRARSELARVARVTTMNTLTASIAHEIKQPLASLITNASIALRRLNADPPNVDGARETVQRTIRDANRASDVITRLRALFSKKEFTLETLDLNEITTEVIALSLSDLQRNRVILRSELAEDLPHVIGDRVQLQQVILNLIRNASDAMVGVEDRPRQLLVRTQREGDDRARLIVQDAGCGVNPQDFERLFEAFYTTKSEGMGIGLSLSRSIIERHQGRLWAEPNDGPGTTFFFSIPRGPNGAKDSAA